MRLIEFKCPKCNDKISSAYTRCPTCGFDVAGFIEEKRRKSIPFANFVTFLIICLIGFGIFHLISPNTDSNEISETVSGAAAATEDRVIDASPGSEEWAPENPIDHLGYAIAISLSCPRLELETDKIGPAYKILGIDVKNKETQLDISRVAAGRQAYLSKLGEAGSRFAGSFYYGPDGQVPGLLKYR